MVTQHKESYRERRSLGDTAVDGLLCGMAAGAVMIGLLIVLEWVNGMPPAEVLGTFGARVPANSIHGLFSHLAVSAIYGILWALLLNLGLRNLRAPQWLLGMVYGLALFALAEYVVAPSTLLSAVAPLSLLSVHVVYGATLGLLSARR